MFPSKATGKLFSSFFLSFFLPFLSLFLSLSLSLFLSFFPLRFPKIGRRFAAFERNKLHQISKIVFNSPKCFTYALIEFFFSLRLVFSLILSFVGCSCILKGTFLYYRLFLIFVFLLTIRGPDILQGRNETFTLV